MTRLLTAALCLPLLAATAPAGDSPGKQPLPPAAETPEAPRDHFRVSAGWMWRSVGGVRFLSGSRSGSRSGSLALPSLFGGSALRDPDIGSPDAYADRTYADGYVGVDEGTEGDGLTSLWGFDSEGQLRGDEIRYHAGGSRRETDGGRSSRAGEDWSGEEDGNAPVIQLDWWREVSPRISLGAQLQWSLLQLDGARRSSDFTAWRESRTFTRSFTDTYDLQGVIPPQAPYEGAGQGDGPLLNNIPTRRDTRESPAGGARAVYFNEVRQSFDLDVNTLSLGPTAAFRAGPVSLQAGAGFALNIADWDASRTETLYLSRDGGPAREVRRWRDHAGGTDFLPGFYLQGGASLPLTPRLSLTGFGRYEWSEELEGSVGPSAFRVDLSGWSAGVTLGLSF